MAKIKINRVKLLALGTLHANPTNPKLPMGAKYRRGLSESFKEFGFGGALCVADNLDGTHEILDGTTRQEDLAAAGVSKIPCAIIEECGGNPDDSEVVAKRTRFRLSYDRNRKKYDEDAVTRQVQVLLQQGQDAAQLAKLAGIDNINALANAADVARQAVEKQKAVATAERTAVEPKASLVIYGPESDVAEIRRIVKELRGRMGTSAKVRQIIAQAAEFADIEDETFLGIFAATLARWGREGAER